VSQPEPVVLDLPFRGTWLARNSPARRVPSHGTTRFGVTHAIDFIAVDSRARSAPRSWRTVLASEPPELFLGFGAPILAPVAGTVVAAHDGERDHPARRSQLALIPYALGQAGRIRGGIDAIAGNHVVIALGSRGPYAAVVHLRCGSISVVPGAMVRAGDQVGECGNSGNSTQPHVHVQVTDSLDWATCRGIPILFRRPAGAGAASSTDQLWMPGESEIVHA